MAKKTPTPAWYERQVVLSAIAILVVGLLLVIVAKLFVGVFIALLGAVFGLADQVTKNNHLD